MTNAPSSRRLAGTPLSHGTQGGCWTTGITGARDGTFCAGATMRRRATPRASRPSRSWADNRAHLQRGRIQSHVCSARSCPLSRRCRTAGQRPVCVIGFWGLSRQRNVGNSMEQVAQCRVLGRCCRCTRHRPGRAACVFNIIEVQADSQRMAGHRRQEPNRRVGVGVRRLALRPDET